MSDHAHFIQLEPNEDATSVRDRLSFLRGQSVLLVWPEKGTLLTRKLDLVLVQREAMRRAIRLALVTHDAQVTKHADELNISVFETIGESERKRWKRGRSKVFANRFQKPQSEADPAELQDVASRVKNAEPANPLRQNLIRVGVTLVLVLLVVGVAYAVVPVATVTLTPAQANVETAVTVTASRDAADVNVDAGVVPVTVLRVDTTQSGTIETSGIQVLDDTRAVGRVVFVNRAAQAVEIPEGTVISTSAGTPVQFRTLEALTLAASIGFQAEVPIEALQDFSGEVGNVAEGQINTVNGPLAGQIDVRNVEPTVGGGSQTAPAVSTRDLERLESMVQQQIQAQAYTEMQPLLGPSQFVILETVRIAEAREDWKTFSAAVGDPVETLTLEMRAVVEASAVDEQFGRQVAFANLSRQVPRGRIIDPPTIQYARGPVSAMMADGSVMFDVTVTASIVEPVDVAEVQQAIAGKSLNDALTYVVNQFDVQPGTVPRISLSPRWLRHMPLLPFRIEVQLEEPL
jgi:hypothetical protein